MHAKIELIRVDNRLVHGQVGVTWTSALNIDTIVVADDEVVTNPFSQKLMESIAKSVNIKIRFYSIHDFMNVYLNHESNQHIFLVIKNIMVLNELVKYGLEKQDVNIGNIHYERNRRPYTRKMYITEDEALIINDLIDRGFNLYYQDVPGTQSETITHIEWNNLKKR